MDNNFDAEEFILEIQRRPALWDSSSEDYSNRDLKRKCWEDIVNLMGGDDLTIPEKKELGFVLQKRWKSIRSCYAREVKRQKSLKSGFAATNRKSEYVYFKQLKFLQNVVVIRDSTEYDGVDLESDEEVSCRPRKIMKTECNLSADGDPLIEVLNGTMTPTDYNRQKQEDDEDRMFLLSLSSTLNGIPRHRKIATKIKILNILKEASDESDMLS